jgi:hypothetical protein
VASGRGGSFRCGMWRRRRGGGGRSCLYLPPDLLHVCTLSSSSCSSYMSSTWSIFGGKEEVLNGAFVPLDCVMLCTDCTPRGGAVDFCRLCRGRLGYPGGPREQIRRRSRDGRGGTVRKKGACSYHPRTGVQPSTIGWSRDCRLGTQVSICYGILDSGIGAGGRGSSYLIEAAANLGVSALGAEWDDSVSAVNSRPCPS